jgi:hypothetical protein
MFKFHLRFTLFEMLLSMFVFVTSISVITLLLINGFDTYSKIINKQDMVREISKVKERLGSSYLQDEILTISPISEGISWNTPLTEVKYYREGSNLVKEEQGRKTIIADNISISLLSLDGNSLLLKVRHDGGMEMEMRYVK